jgi:PEGA domain-containing protein
MRLLCSVVAFSVVLSLSAFSQSDERPRVFITDSQSWEVHGSAGGANGAFGASSSGGARPQTAEIIKTFGEKCPQAIVNNRQEKANYIVVLDHEGGKNFLRHKNKVAVFESQSGDTIVSHSTLSLGGSVEDACDAIKAHWAAHGEALRKAASAPAAPPAAQPPAAQPPPPAAAAPAPPDAKAAAPHISVASTPGAADIELDGSFVGSTPSVVEVAPGEHTIVIRKNGFKEWSRKMKFQGGDIKIDAELEKAEPPK